MRLRVELPIDKEQLDALIGIAIRHGFMREEPKRVWSNRERKEAARYAMERIISERINAWMNRG